MKNLYLAIVIALASMTFTSCISDSEDSFWNYTFTDNLTHVTNKTTGEAELFNGANYTIECNLNEGTATLIVKNLILGQSDPYTGLVLRDLKYSYNTEGALVVNAAAAVSNSNGEIHSISSLSLIQYLRTAPTGIECTYSISYVVDGIYEVRAVQSSATYTGSTQITNLTDDDTSTSDNPYYAYSLDLKTKTAKLASYGLRWDGTTHSSLVISAIPFTIDSNGIHLKSDGPLTPTIDFLDKADTPVTNIDATVSYNGRMTARMTIDDNYRVVAILGEPVSPK